MKPLTSNLILGFGLSLGLTSCALPAIKALPPDNTMSNNGQTELTKPSNSAILPAKSLRSEAQPVLYARDGSVVGQQKSGTIAMSSNGGQRSAAKDGTGWTLLEQYQTTIDENEGLQVEVVALNQALDQAEKQEKDLLLRIQQLTAELGQQTEKIGTLEGQNIELAARLTTAQIRRLQSEKLLLEAKLDWKRVETVINSSEASSATGKRTGTEVQSVNPQPQSSTTNQP